MSFLVWQYHIRVKWLKSTLFNYELIFGINLWEFWGGGRGELAVGVMNWIPRRNWTQRIRKFKNSLFKIFALGDNKLKVTTRATMLILKWRWTLGFSVHHQWIYINHSLWPVDSRPSNAVLQSRRKAVVVLKQQGSVQSIRGALSWTNVAMSGIGPNISQSTPSYTARMGVNCWTVFTSKEV